MENNKAFAALDIGTSRIKVGVYLPENSDQVNIIESLDTDLVKSSKDRVEVNYQTLKGQLEPLLFKLGKHLTIHRVDQLYFGICGQVSSLFSWDKRGFPISDTFPIWMDRRCESAIPEFKNLTERGKSQEVMGSFLPPGTNWLLTKLLHQKQFGFPENQIWVQVGDALFYELTGTWKSHFSSQVSMVHQHQQSYVQHFLSYLGLKINQFPILEKHPARIQPNITEKFGLPSESYAFPALGDFYAAFLGMQLQNNEGFMLANTSEVVGVFTHSKTELPNNFVNVSLGKNHINYGSTSSGGNLIPWFYKNHIKEPVSVRSLNNLTLEASKISPEDTPVFLPYIHGERAPLWETRIKESWHEQRDEHTKAHLFRGVLEGVGFARRHCFDALKNNAITQIKVAGGSTVNQLWNQIRSNIIGKKLLISNEKELAIVGTILHMIDALQAPINKPAIQYHTIIPDPKSQEVYEKKYKHFLKYQQQQLATL